MTEAIFKPRGLHYEDFEIGQLHATQARTITEADIVNFAGLTGDFNQIHTDAVYAGKDTFGKRVAHGMLVQSIATGLAVLSGIIEGTVLAFRELDCKFSLPVYIGDTVHVEIEITEKKFFKRLKGGNVLMKYKVVNQEGKTVQRGNWTMLIKSNAADG